MGVLYTFLTPVLQLTGIIQFSLPSPSELPFFFKKKKKDTPPLPKVRDPQMHANNVATHTASTIFPPYNAFHPHGGRYAQAESQGLIAKRMVATSTNTLELGVRTEGLVYLPHPVVFGAVSVLWALRALEAHFGGRKFAEEERLQDSI